jgi:hypothetical protein
VVPLQQFLPDALAAAVRKAPLTPEKVAFAWRLAVGAATANATQVTLGEGVLRVTARDRQWQREILRATPIVLGRLRAVLGDAVSRLDVTAPPVSPPSADAAGTARRRR